jgi:hypothetical protein
MRRTFTLSLNLDSQDFNGEEGFEEYDMKQQVAALLGEVALRVGQDLERHGALKDTNGKTIGRFWTIGLASKE